MIGDRGVLVRIEVSIRFTSVMRLHPHCIHTSKTSIFPHHGKVKLQKGDLFGYCYDDKIFITITSCNLYIKLLF